MMYVLSTLIPYYLQHLKSKKEGSTEVDVKKEMKNMRYLTKYVATIIELYEHLRNSIHDVTTPDHRGGGELKISLVLSLASETGNGGGGLRTSLRFEMIS